MKTKEIAIWVGIIAVLIGGLWFLITTVNNSSSPSSPVQMTNVPPVSENDFVKKGNTASSASESAKVTLIEYGDFECPACGVYYPLVKQISEEFGKDLRVVHRFFPLTNVHKNAMISAQAAYAAGLQGKFWEMHNMLYENQSSWSETNPKDIFISYAKDLELDLDKFKTDLEADSTKQFIKQQEQSAISIGINSTPTFILNEARIQNPANYEAFKKLIQDEINKK